MEVCIIAALRDMSSCIVILLDMKKIIIGSGIVTNRHLDGKISE